MYTPQNHVGSIPPKSFYDPDGMKDKDKKKFEEWYQVQTGTFDFKKELLEYCQSVRRSRNSFHKKPASTRLKSVQPSRQRGTNCNSNS